MLRTAERAESERSLPWIRKPLKTEALNKIAGEVGLKIKSLFKKFDTQYGVLSLRYFINIVIKS